ncbi:LysR family transcriptional regulator [Alcaligenaceae bacterium]|nr:LysR family transcriptional regulator [Alcaligenaceae bacterium]
MKLEFKQIRAFLVVAEELHFGRAARRLHISQPPLTQIIQKLEASVGVSLLQRTTRQVRLTPAGQAFQEHARAAFKHMDHAVFAARRAAEGEIGMLRIGFAASAAYNLLPGIMSVFRERYPDLRLHLEEQASPELLYRLVSERIDVALLRPETVPVGVRMTAVGEEPLYVAVASHHPLSGEQRIGTRQLQGMPFIGFSQSRYLDRLIRQIVGQDGVMLNIVQESELPTILTLVAARVGIAIVPASARDMRTAGMVYRPLVTGSGRAAPCASLMVAYPDEYANAAVDNFVEIAQQVAGAVGMSASGAWAGGVPG